MHRFFAGVLIAGLALAGCSKSSEKGGRAGNDTFKVSVPAMAANVKQGELQTVRVAVERGEGFTQVVKVQLQAPAGLQVDPKDTTVQPGDKGDIQVRITAAADAPLGQHTILVKGTPDKGESTETQFKVNVSAQ